MQPLVSILMPAYNAEEWISESLHSAMAQTWQRKEIIVVDDGSRDRTAEIARRLCLERRQGRIHRESGTFGGGKPRLPTLPRRLYPGVGFG